MFLLQALNQGLGEGIFYRGRVLLALSVEVYSSPSAVSADTGSGALGKVLPSVHKLYEHQTSQSMFQ